jgi:hypothetical protein
MGSSASSTFRDLFLMSPTPTTMGVFLATPIFVIRKGRVEDAKRQCIQNKRDVKEIQPCEEFRYNQKESSYWRSSVNRFRAAECGEIYNYPASARDSHI